MFKDLVARRVPHILGLYLAAGWAVLEFTDWAVGRYVLSPYLTDLALVAWALLIPSVLMLAYYHGRPGRDEWATVEKVGIPVNVLLAVAALSLAFWGKELGAATTEITVRDETGAEIERVVPKSEFRKRLALFYFANESGDTALDWLQYGIPLALSDDLAQDIFLDVRTSYPYFGERLKEAGYPDGLRLPLALRRDIAEEFNLPFFVSGSIRRTSQQLEVTVSLYDTGRGNVIQERSYTGSGVFVLVDRMSIQLKHDLGVPNHHIEEVRDLPAAEMLTTSETAYRSYVDGARAIVTEDWAGAVAGFAAATREDPAYAAAHLSLYFSHLLQNDMASATAAIEAAMQHAYKLPERTQFVMKAAYYRLVKQDIEKTLAVAGMHSELFPDDIAAHNVLLILHIQNGERERAIAAAKRILELDPGEREMLRLIGELNLDLGRFAEAERYYSEYTEKAPKDPAGFASLGRMSGLLGRHDPARGHYESALALEPGNVPVLIDLARIETATGRFREAEAQLADALAAASTPMQRWQAYDALRGYHERRGEMARAIDDLENAWSELERAQPPVIAFQVKMGGIDTYVRGGQGERADAIMKALEDQLSSPFDLILAFGYLQLSIELEDATGIQEALQGMDTLIATLGVEVLRPLALYGRGRLLELQGQCDQAIIAYERALEISPTSFSFNTDVGRCYRVLKRNELAEERLRRVLEIEPYAPLTNLELARALANAGRNPQALEYVDRALEVWENADPAFKPAREARELRARLAQSS